MYKVRSEALQKDILLGRQMITVSFASRKKPKKVDTLSNIMEINFLKKVKDYPVVLEKRMGKASSGATVGLFDHLGEIRNMTQLRFGFRFFASAIQFNLMPE